jgi:V/A-type H+-transporting ATPase subunit I
VLELINILLANMFRPERMIEASIIFLRKDSDLALEALDDFGNFHVEEMNETPNPTHYEQLVRRTEETIVKLNEVESQLKTGKVGLLDVFKAKEPVRQQIIAENWEFLIRTVEQESSELGVKVNSLTTSLRTLDEELSSLRHVHDMLRILDRFKIDSTAFEELTFIYAVVATAPSRNTNELGKVLSSYGIFYHSLITKSEEFVFIATPSKYKDEIEKTLKTHHAEIFQIPKGLPKKTSEALEKVDDQSKKALESRKTVMGSLESFKEAHGHRLLGLREAAQNVLRVLHAKQKSLETERTVAAKGYVPRRAFAKLQKEIDSKLNGRALVLGKEFTASEDPPTMIRNHSFIKPFESITSLYGLPHYDEVDPTPLIAITFPLIFGFMFGDIGHGLILLMSGLTLGLLIKKSEGLRNFSWILAACGVGTIFAGLLFGEFFGNHVFGPLWFRPFDDVTRFLVFSLFVGIVQITIGFALEFTNFILKGSVIDAFLTSLPKILFYIGSVYLIVVYQLNFAKWFEGPILLPLIPFIFLISGKAIVMKTLKILGHPTGNLNKNDSFLERFFESGDLITRLLSNTMSYARILALLMAHWALLLATYATSDIVFTTPVFGAVLGALVIVGGNIFVIAFEGLIVFIHTLRLHFYEWFSRFYQGTGVKFSPFKQSRAYSEVLLKR